MIISYSVNKILFNAIKFKFKFKKYTFKTSKKS